MKAVLASIHPIWCCEIANEKKTYEVRKNRPNLEEPFKCYIYCTAGRPWMVYGDVFHGNWESEYTVTHGYNRKRADEIWGVMNGKVIGEFVCDRILQIDKRGVNNNFDYCYESLSVFGNDDIEPYITAIKKSGISKDALNEYGIDSDFLYAWHISNLTIYEVPKELNQFSRFGAQFLGCACLNRACKNFVESVCYDEPPECRITDCTLYRPPQSWCYVEEKR